MESIIYLHTLTISETYTHARATQPVNGMGAKKETTVGRIEMENQKPKTKKKKN